MPSDPNISDLPAEYFPVVGIGTSAGGLEAVSELLSALPATTGMAFVVVQHLDPGHASMLVEILEKRTALAVVEARDGMALAPNRLHVIPPNATLALSDGVLRVTPREGPGSPGLIDTFFRSLATEHGHTATGVLLSGAGSDGTRGAQEIQGAGGWMFVQDPDSAAFDSMPRSAIHAGVADEVLRPADIGRRLAALAAPLASGGARHAARAASEATGSDEELWKRIFRLLRGASGIDFTHYKRSTLERRVARRQGFKHVIDLEAYAELLAEDTAELNALAQDLLIGVTSFFRDPETFEGLAHTVFPALLEAPTPHTRLRIWAPGCASGEELYSIAICLLEYLGERATTAPVQFFGTDASEAAIARAREGRYPDGIEAEVSPERLQRFFVKRDHHYQIAKSIRDLCVFARHDVTRDPPFSRIDLVSCRNLLIYLDAALQRHVLAQLHYAINPHGFLVLGPSEGLAASTDLFEQADKKRRIFTRRALQGPAGQPREPASSPRSTIPPVGDPSRIQLEVDRWQEAADRMLLARYAPPAIVVDEELNVHQFRGDTGRFLAHAPGPASLNLQQLAPPALLVALVPALREARTARAPVRRDDVRIEAEGGSRKVSVEVSPIGLGEDSGSCYLVVLEEAAPRRSPGLWQSLLDTASRHVSAPSVATEEVEELRRELAATREFLRSSAEEYEATKEELKSLHEEALSANEEFQSTNEELETAKEELQSANEELTTTNDELRNRHHQLSELNDSLAESRDFAEAIVATVRHPLLVLDRKLRVQSANPAFYHLFRVEAGDTEGKLLFDLGDGQWDLPQLRALLDETLATPETVEDVMVTHHFAGIGTRTMILNARRLGGRKSEAHLILLGIEDATERLGVKASLEDADRRKDEFLAMLGHELRNPLAPIRSSIDVLRRIDIQDERLRSFVDVLDRQTAQMVRLVDDLLEMSRIARGTLTLEVAEMDLGDAVTRAVESARPLIDARGHHLSVGEPPRTMRVRGDLARLTQLFSNLLVNAAKYTPQGGEIACSVGTAGAEAEVIVSDNGQGLSAELLPHLFDAFGLRAGTSRTGLGIGLPLARRLTELHGGTLEARSEGPGKGSTFTVRLPLLDGARPAPASSLASATAPDLDGCRVLVVDDNADAANALRILLELSGGEVRCAYDGASTLALVGEFDPDVVLLDLALPDVDGYEVLRRMRTSPGRRPAVVALTGFAQPADIARMKQAGFDGTLIKPADGDTIAALLPSLRRKPS